MKKEDITQSMRLKVIAMAEARGYKLELDSLVRGQEKCKVAAAVEIVKRGGYERLDCTFRLSGSANYALWTDHWRRTPDGQA